MSLAPSRAELVRFFAWGYLSRRELSAKLQELEPTRRSAAA
jgi:hypothetical protein